MHEHSDRKILSALHAPRKSKMEPDAASNTLEEPPLDPNANIERLFNEKKKEILLAREQKKREEEQFGIKAETARLDEYYDTIVLERRQLQGLRQTERFAKRIATLQKAVSERAIELTEAQMNRDQLQTRVNELNTKNEETIKILNKLVILHNKLRPNETKVAMTIETFTRKTREIEREKERVSAEEHSKINDMFEAIGDDVHDDVGVDEEQDVEDHSVLSVWK